MASATRLSRLAAALGVGLLALALAGVALVPTPAAAVSCTPFGDAGCFMGEDFETFTVGQIPPSPWSPNGRGATDVKIATPGLNGTNKKMRFAVDPDNSGWPGGCQSCPLIDTGVSGTAAVGTKYWLEFWVEYEAGFQWGCGANCSMKTIDINGVGTNERILLTVWGSANDTPAFSKGHTFWSMYPNYQPGGTDAGGATNKATEKFANVTDVALQAGQTYHIVLEVTVGTGTTGAYRAWVNGTLMITYGSKGLVTVTVSAPSATPTGYVTLVVDDGAPLIATLLNRRAQFTVRNLAVGDHPLTATYTATGPYASCSASGSLHVDPKSRGSWRVAAR